MTIDAILELVESFRGTVTLSPKEGDGSPEIAWGDTFFHYAPDGEVPATTQPFATIVTKDYPGDARSRLDDAGRFRVNFGVGRAAFTELVGAPLRNLPDEEDAGRTDVLFAHPVYGSLGWLAVVNPGPATDEKVRQLLHDACESARKRYERRGAL